MLVCFHLCWQGCCCSAQTVELEQVELLDTICFYRSLGTRCETSNCLGKDAVVLLSLWSLWSSCGAWASGENHQGDNRPAHAEQASTHKCIVASAEYLQPSNPLQFANAKLFGRGWTIAMRCEQLQYDSATIASNFSVHCIPCKAHYAVAWGALMHWQYINIQYRMFNTWYKTRTSWDVCTLWSCANCSWLYWYCTSCDAEWLL